MTCGNEILSEDTYEFILTEDEKEIVPAEPICISRVSDEYSVRYYQRKELPDVSVTEFSYPSIPKCYSLLNTLSLEVSGILKMQNIPTLSLKGQGVFVAVIDTGIAYADPVFLTSDKKSRIFSIWDQTAETKEEAEDQPLYGRIYSRNEINDALSNENPYQVIPNLDTDGHGTFLASVAAGSEDISGDFIGAAPEAELLIVRLKPAKQYLKTYYYIPNDRLVFAESDIMNGIAYAEKEARKQDKPLVIFLGLGTNNGSHTGTGPLCEYLDQIGVLRHRAVVTALGNEANARHHFFGQTTSVLSPRKVEINVEKDMSGFYAELWALAPERVSISVQSPTGEVLLRMIPISATRQTIRFVFEETLLSVEYRESGKGRRDQLILLRFSNAKAGIWTILVYPESAITGQFHIWLPMRDQLEQEVFFLESNPDTTLTSPSDSQVSMSVGAYRASDSTIYFDSSRGYEANGVIKPDFLAPGVEVSGKGLRENFITGTGTSASAAITAGACAQVLEWAVTQKNAIGINSLDIQNLFIRGGIRNPNLTYPSKEYGYGRLDVYQAFETIRQTP